MPIGTIYSSFELFKRQLGHTSRIFLRRRPRFGFDDFDEMRQATFAI